MHNQQVEIATPDNALMALAPTQVGERLGVSRETVRHLCESGEIRAFDVSRPGCKSKRWRITPAALQEFCERRSNIADRPSVPRGHAIISELALPSSGRDYFGGAEG